MSILTVYTAQLQLIIYRSHRLNVYTALSIYRDTHGALFLQSFQKQNNSASTRACTPHVHDMCICACTALC